MNRGFFLMTFRAKHVGAQLDVVGLTDGNVNPRWGVRKSSPGASEAVETREGRVLGRRERS
jgi:hypothetical protein